MRCIICGKRLKQMGTHMAWHKRTEVKKNQMKEVFTTLTDEDPKALQSAKLRRRMSDIASEMKTLLPEMPPVMSVILRYYIALLERHVMQSFHEERNEETTNKPSNPVDSGHTG